MFALDPVDMSKPPDNVIGEETAVTVTASTITGVPSAQSEPLLSLALVYDAVTLRTSPVDERTRPKPLIDVVLMLAKLSTALVKLLAVMK